MESNHVGVALAEDHLAALRSRSAGQIGSVDLTALMEDDILGAVQILGLLVRSDRSRAEAENAATGVAERKGDSPTEAVVNVPLLILRCQPGVPKLGFAVAALT
ncbi:unannotated protein [freshwater metagenome]|uniref:Unannotated protein n=1 Tax=freshwater metagenome TaxID=449393 RepID=A0A6J5ZSY4_9ZZZZ